MLIWFRCAGGCQTLLEWDCRFGRERGRKERPAGLLPLSLREKVRCPCAHAHARVVFAVHMRRSVRSSREARLCARARTAASMTR